VAPAKGAYYISSAPRTSSRGLHRLFVVTFLCELCASAVNTFSFPSWSRVAERAPEVGRRILTRVRLNDYGRA
jgi:hypothetical protein